MSAPHSAAGRPGATSIFWFRNDLRLADNPGLAAALATGGTVLLYVLDDAAAGAWANGGASRWWLHHSLHALAQDIAARGGRLLLRRGKAAEIIPGLAAELGATEVHAARAIDPGGRAQERALEAGLRDGGVALHRHPASLLFGPEEIRTRTGGIYSVYTPFARACHERPPPIFEIAAPKKLAPVARPDSDRLADWRLLPEKPDWAGGLRADWTPGEAGAASRLHDLLEGKLAKYNIARDIPGEEGTSRLSPHLHFGEISPARIWRAAMAAKHPGAGLTTFLNELLWREFSHYLLWHHPDMPEQPLRRGFADFPWRHERKSLRAWQRGQTGIPIVDAGMRQLWQTGWMHNRLRLICASFLVKHLLIPWQDGQAWFWDTLVDADLADNSNNWQWVAGCGADAAPYFRIFNPVLQGRKFDPGGDYVRQFVPELRALPDKDIHCPWEAESAVLAAAGVDLDRNYPRPVIGLDEGRQRALAALRQISRR